MLVHTCSVKNHYIYNKWSYDTSTNYLHAVTLCVGTDTGRNFSCADCDAELTDYGNIWASVEQGCFVCVHCLAAHRSLGFRTKSVNMDFWAVDEVARMTSMGNVKVGPHTDTL